MKIFLIVDTYFPSPKSAGKHFYDLAIELIKQGHEPTVLTPSESAAFPYTEAVEDGIHVVRVKIPTLKHPSLPVRALREATLPFKVWRRAKSYFTRNHFDLIVFYSPTIFWGPLVATLKRRWQCPATLLLRDISPQWMLDAGILRTGPIYFFFRLIELAQYHVANVIAIQSDGDIEHFAKQPKYLAKKVRVLYNWAPTDEGALPNVNFRKQLKLEGKVIFFYGGTFGRAQNMESVVNLAAKLQHEKKVVFLLVGSGTEESRIKARVATESIDNLLILPPVGQREFLALVSEIDIGIISLSPKLRTHNIPGKLLSYAYFAKPVLANLNKKADLGPLLESYQAGLVSDSGNDAQFFDNAMVFFQNAELRLRFGQNNRRLLESKFSSEAAVAAIMSFIEP